MIDEDEPGEDTEPKMSAVEEIDAGGDGFGEGNDPSGEPLPQGDGDPSAADLDAVAEEQAAFEATTV